MGSKVTPHRLIVLNVFYFYFFIFIFERERERGEEGQREGDRRSKLTAESPT